MLANPVSLLAWPINLFKGIITAPDRQPGDAELPRENLCDCGCALPHNFTTWRLVGEQGRRTVLCYRTTECETRHLKLAA